MDETRHDIVDTTPAAKFRARKRRRLDDAAAAGEEEDLTVKQLNDQSNDSTTIPTSLASNIVRRSTAQRRGGGITFNARPASQSARASDQPNINDSAMDLVPLTITNDRFARATGNIGVVEDTHMTAYIDHKLAAIRGPGKFSSSEAKTSLSDGLDPSPVASLPLPPPSLSSPSNSHIAATAHSSTRPTHARAGLDDIEEVQLDTLPSQQRRLQNHHHSGGNRNLPSEAGFPNAAAKTGKTGTVEEGKRRRDKTSAAARPAEAIARDAMIEDIMREGLVSLYDTTRPSSSLATGATAATTTTTTTTTGRLQAGEDKDAAIAEAFQAEFLAEMEERSLRRRQPPAPSISGGGGAVGAKNNHVASGPKLGGSRSMREKMRAATQAQTNPAVTKK